MKRFTQWVTDKFEHPLSLLFFLLGTILILLAVTKGLKVPGLDQLVADERYQWVAVASAIVFLGLAVLIYYHPPKSSKTLDAVKALAPIPDEFRKPFMNRLAGLSEMQKDILGFVERRSNFDNAASVSQESIEKAFEASAKAEMFYRLEHLRLMGFIEKQELDEDRYTYRLSPAYKLEIGDRPPRPPKSSERPR